MTFDANQTALLASGEFGDEWLLELQLKTGNVYFTTYPVTLQIGGKTWLGLGGNLTIGAVKETDRLSNDKVQVALPASSNALVAMVLNDVEAYRGRPALLSLQLMSANGVPVGDPRLRLRATMEPGEIQYESRAEKSAGGRIVIALRKEGRGRSRNVEGRRLSDAQQRSEYPGDTGMRYHRQLIEAPAVWLSKEFQKQ